MQIFHRLSYQLNLNKPDPVPVFIAMLRYLFCFAVRFVYLLSSAAAPVV